jgi:hypothetical protein
LSFMMNVCKVQARLFVFFSDPCLGLDVSHWFFMTDLDKLFWQDCHMDDTVCTSAHLNRRHTRQMWVCPMVGDVKLPS